MNGRPIQVWPPVSLSLDALCSASAPVALPPSHTPAMSFPSPVVHSLPFLLEPAEATMPQLKGYRIALAPSPFCSLNCNCFSKKKSWTEKATYTLSILLDISHYFLLSLYNLFLPHLYISNIFIFVPFSPRLHVLQGQVQYEIFHHIKSQG